MRIHGHAVVLTALIAALATGLRAAHAQFYEKVDLARAAVENMMRTLATEWARFGIRTCAIAPGQFATETFVSKYPKEVVESVHQTIPMGRLGREEEFAWLVAYLASPAGAFHSGSVITVDGGRDNWFGQFPPEAFGSGELPAEER